ncbi:MAG: UDP-N-acetylmuramate dehydrogenase [Lachnospiraceae bacterium]|nr:UDP-N-acetylmuramate dehydrogenase [Lachnospiraceae bacterium]
MALDELKLAEDITVETDDVQIILGEYMWDHTSFRIGGAADVYVRPLSEEGLLVTLDNCRRQRVPYRIIGKGTNLLVSDRGIRGAVIDMTGLDGISSDGTRITAGCGAALVSLANFAAERALSGLEFAAGIPGSLGGGIFMNAGAYGGEMKDVVRSVRVLTPGMEIVDVPAEEAAFGYRDSRFKTSGEIILGAELELVPGVREEIEARMKDYNARRREKQPLELPSAGSTFKRPEGNFAGKLIQDAGLAGYQVGQAQVSPKHCGFVVNLGGASARDVYRLIRDVQAKVKESSGVELEPEVVMLGEFA